MSTKRERIILSVTVLVVAAWVLDSFILTPLANRSSDLRQRQERLSAEFLANQNKLRRRRVLARSWSSWVHGGLRQDPSEAESQILDAVRSWSRETGVKLVSIQPERPSQRGELREIRFQASAYGAYESLVRFLYRLESADVPIRPQRLELRAIKGGSGEQLVLDLRFSTLYLVPDRGDEKPPRRPTRSAAAPQSSRLKVAGSWIAGRTFGT